MKLEKIYICHWKKLKDRKENLLKSLGNQNIKNYVFVEDYDKDDWNLNELKKKFPYVFKKTPKGRNLNNSETSLLLKHYHIMRDLNSSDSDYALVLEDDVVFCDNFLNNLEVCYNQFPSDWDLVWVGTCCNLHSEYIEGKYVYPETSSRCTHAYLISKKCSNKILNSEYKITEAIDHLYNFFIRTLKLNNYWIEPALAIQNPKYKTTIQGSN